LELIDRERRMVERRIKAAKFPTVKSLDSFDFAALPSLNKALVMELARSEYVERRENIIAVGNSGTGKSPIAQGLGLAACQKGFSVGFTTAGALVHELIEARDEKRLLRLQRQLASHKLLIIDELGYVPLSQKAPRATSSTTNTLNAPPGNAAASHPSPGLRSNPAAWCVKSPAGGAGLSRKPDGTGGRGRGGVVPSTPITSSPVLGSEPLRSHRGAIDMMMERLP
jgi:hypothetical protein